MPLSSRDETARSSTKRSLVAYLKTPAWASSAMVGAPDNDVVLASRARLARNLAGFPFPNRASERDLRRVAQDIRRAALADTERLADLYAIAIETLSPRDRADLTDARRISPELAEGGANRYALLDEAGMLAIFINEEDHIRIQAIVAGNDAKSALRSAEDTDLRLARRLNYMVDAQWGYLTASLSNVGTGLRLSVLAHLPALAFLGRLTETLKAFHSLDISVRGAHGEHSEAVGDLYQISNATTYGLRTEFISGRVRPVADYLVAAEREARKEVAETHSIAVMKAARVAWDRVEEADRLDAVTALELLSALRLASASGLRPLGDTPAPNAELFATLVADLHTGAGLVSPPDATQPYFKSDIGAFKAKILTNSLYRALGVAVTGKSEELTTANVAKLLSGSGLVVDTFDNSVARQTVKDACIAANLPCLHVGLAADYAEVIWNDRYRVPSDVNDDVCDYPLARNIVLLAVSVAAEVIVRFAATGEKENYTLTLGDFAIRPFETIE